MGKLYLLPEGGSGPHLIRDSVDLPESTPPNGISTGSAVTVQLMFVSNRHIDHHATYVAIGRTFALRAYSAAYNVTCNECAAV